MLFFLLPYTITEKRSSIFNASLIGKNFPPFLSSRLFKLLKSLKVRYPKENDVFMNFSHLSVSFFLFFLEKAKKVALNEAKYGIFFTTKIEFFAWKSNLIDHLGNPDLARGSFVKKRSDPAKIQQVCKQSHSTAKQVHFVPENQFCNALKTSLALQKL